MKTPKLWIALFCVGCGLAGSQAYGQTITTLLYSSDGNSSTYTGYGNFSFESLAGNASSTTFLEPGVMKLKAKRTRVNPNGVASAGSLGEYSDTFTIVSEGHTGDFATSSMRFFIPGTLSVTNRLLKKASF